MKKVFLTTVFLLLIFFSYSGITSAFLGGVSFHTPISESFNLLLLGMALIGIATWGKKKFR